MKKPTLTFYCTDSTFFLRIYRSLIHSKGSYATEVYFSVSKTLLSFSNTMDHSQRLVNGSFYTTPCTNLYIIRYEMPPQRNTLFGSKYLRRPQCMLITTQMIMNEVPQHVPYWRLYFNHHIFSALLNPEIVTQQLYNENLNKVVIDTLHETWVKLQKNLFKNNCRNIVEFLSYLRNILLCLLIYKQSF